MCQKKVLKDRERLNIYIPVERVPRFTFIFCHLRFVFLLRIWHVINASQFAADAFAYGERDLVGVMYRT